MDITCLHKWDMAQHMVVVLISRMFDDFFPFCPMKNDQAQRVCEDYRVRTFLTGHMIIELPGSPADYLQTI